MINNINYSNTIHQVREASAKQVSAERTRESSALYENKKAEQDTVILSNAALALMKGEKVEEIAAIYDRPKMASMLENKPVTESVPSTDEKNTDNKDEEKVEFADIMQAVIDNRLGIDREKLEEIEAKIEEIANDKSLTPEEKATLIEQLEVTRENLIKEFLEKQEVAKQVDNTPREEKINEFN